jgi:hypothetical protein
MITVEYLDEFCVVRFLTAGKVLSKALVPKDLGEQIEKLAIENKQLKERLG